MRRRWAIVIATLLALAWPRATSAKDRFAEYEQLVDRYRHGRYVESVAELGAWPPDDVRRAAATASSLRAWDKLPAAILLHAERSLHELAHGSSRAYDVHVDIALRLARAQLQALSARRFSPRWFLAVALLNTNVEGAMGWLKAGLKAHPDDAGLLLALGSFEESPLAFAAGDVDLRPSESGWHTQAEQHLARALSIDPGLHEARIRRAHLFMNRGHDDAAQKELELVLERAHEPQLLYFAHLLYGRVREHQGRLTEAVQAYSAASELDPRCQTAAVALSQALWRLGDSTGAGAAARRAIVRTEPASGCLDPWWLYPWAQRWRLSTLLTELRREVST